MSCFIFGSVVSPSAYADSISLSTLVNLKKTSNWSLVILLIWLSVSLWIIFTFNLPKT